MIASIVLALALAARPDHAIANTTVRSPYSEVAKADVSAMGYRPAMCYDRGEQKCEADNSWYCCGSPECTLHRSCDSNTGLLGCACPLEDPTTCSGRTNLTCTGICFWADGGCRTDMQAGAKGLRGDKGDKGDKGHRGDQGPAGISGDVALEQRVGNRIDSERSSRESKDSELSTELYNTRTGLSNLVDLVSQLRHELNSLGSSYSSNSGGGSSSGGSSSGGGSSGGGSSGGGSLDSADRAWCLAGHNRVDLFNQLKQVFSIRVIDRIGPSLPIDYRSPLCPKGDDGPCTNKGGSCYHYRQTRNTIRGAVSSDETVCLCP